MFVIISMSLFVGKLIKYILKYCLLLGYYLLLIPHLQLTNLQKENF